MRVCIVGAGLGDRDTLTVAGLRALSESDLVIGAKRLLGLVAPDSAARCAALTGTARIAEEVEAAAKGGRVSTVTVLMSGDVGFYSGARLLSARLAHVEGCDVELIAGVSSVQVFCGKLGVSWHDAHLVSAHGRACNASGAVRTHGKTFFLTGGDLRVQDLCASLVESGLADVTVHAGENLGANDERIVSGPAHRMAQERFGDLAVMLAVNEHPLSRPFGAPCISDDGFERGEVPMTKEEVRALAVSKLRIAPDATVWDVGAGTGSVSVECALAAPEGRVFAVERNHEACKLVKRNAARFGASNVFVVGGDAPEVLEGLPAPDCVFVGGSTGRIASIVDAVLDANPQARIVVSAIVLETLSGTLDAFSARGIEVEVVSVSIARARRTGPSHMMMANNPVYLVSAGGGPC